MTSGSPTLKLGLAITTIGRPALGRLLESAAESSVHPIAVAIANQSRLRLLIDPAAYPFPVIVVSSPSGVSAGRNAALQALPPSVDVIGFPNDDSHYPPMTLAAVLREFTKLDPPDAIACTLEAPYAEPIILPTDGTTLTRRSVWRAIEPALFVRRSVVDEREPFRSDLGVGSPSPWQSGEGTDLLLRLLAAGGRVRSTPNITVQGPGERRNLSPSAYVAKQRRYARGTGYVYRLHRYPITARARILAGPWRHPLEHDPQPGLSLRLATARSIGRLEGLCARTLPGAGATVVTTRQ